VPKSRPSANPAQVRGDIERGSTGDKLPGFDPAAAPLETDAEAGGEPLSPDQVSNISGREEPRNQGSRNEGSHGPALRHFDRPREDHSPFRQGWLLAILAAVVLTLVAVALLT